MTIDLGIARLRKPEPADLDALYQQKNDPEVTSLLGGSTRVYSRSDLSRWMEFHASATDEVLLTIADGEDRCLGHVGLYHLDHRCRSAEFGIMIGERSAWGRGLGRACTLAMIRFGFVELQLHRIYLDVLDTNVRAIRLYESIGFGHEGTRRDAQWKGGRFHDVRCMAILEDDWRQRHDRA